MAQQFEVQALGLNGIPYRIEIYNSNYSGTTVTQLDGDQQFIRFEGGQRERVGIEPIWGKEVRINVRTNEDLSPLFGLEDRDAEVRVFRTDTSSLVWKGFILTDFFQDEPLTDLPGVELRAVDGLTTLEGDSFDALSGVSDSDIGEDGSFISYTDLFTGVLSTLYDSPLDVEFAVEWYPDAGGQLTSSDNPLRFSGARPDVFYDSEDGEWFNQQSALEDALKSQGLEVRQSVIGGELTWLVAQPTALSVSSVKTWRYAPGGTEDTSSPFTRDLSLDLSTADTNRPTREFERRSGSVSVTHDHTEIDQLVSNPSFENAVGQNWTLRSGSNFDSSVVSHSNAGLTPSPVSQDQNTLEVEQTSQVSSSSIVVAAEQNLGEVSEFPDGTSATLSFRSAANITGSQRIALSVNNNWHLKNFFTGLRQETLAGETEILVDEIKRDIPVGATLPIVDQNAPPGDAHKASITLSERAESGTGKLVGQMSEKVTDTSLDVLYAGFVSNADEVFIPLWKPEERFILTQIRFSWIDSSGNVLSGDVDLELRHSLSTSSSGGPAYWDNIGLELTENQNPISSTTTRAGVPANGKEREVSVLLSSGPTSENPRRVKGLAPGDTSYQATDWGIGAGGGSLSLAGLQARERLRYLREHLERQQITVYARDKSPVVTGEEIVQFDGKTWRIAEFSSDPASGEIGLTLIQHADAGTTDLSIATVRDAEDGGTSGGSGTAPAVGGGGGGGGTGIEVIQLDASSGNVTETLPTPSSGATALALRVDTSTGNTATLNTPGSQEIRFPEGKDKSSTTLGVEQSLLLSSDGSHWYVEEGQGLSAEAEAVTTDAATKDSPSLTQTATYDSDGTTSVTSSDVSIERYVRTDTDGNATLVYESGGTEIARLSDEGRFETRADQEAFADGSFGSGSSTNSLLQVEDAGTVRTTDAASLNFKGSGVSLARSGDEITVDVSGGSGSDIDIESNQSVVVGGATGLSFEGSGIDSVDNDGDGTATVNISKGNSTEVQEGGTAQVSDVTVLDFVGADFSVANPTSGEAEVSLQNDTVTVAGNAVSLGGSTGIAHGDLSSIGSSDHHAKTTSAADLTDVSADSVSDAHHAKYTDADAVDALQAHDGTNVDVDTVDGYEGADLAAEAEDETISGSWTFNSLLTAEKGIDVRQPQNAPAIELEHNVENSDLFATIRGPNNRDLRFELRDNGSGDSFDFRNSSGDTLATILAGGNTGFGGETAPSYALDVNGTAAADTVRLGDYTIEEGSTNGDLNFFHSGSKLLELTDSGILRAAGDVVAFGLSGGSGTGSTSGLQSDAPLTLDTTTDPDTIGLSVGSGLTVNNGTLEADGSVGVSSVFGRTGDVTAQSGDYTHSQISNVSSDDHHTRYSDEEAQDAVGTIMSGSGAASVTYDDAGNTITISATDTDTQLSDSEVQTAINNDADHGSTASHNYFTASEARSAVEGTSDVADLVGNLGTSGQVPQTDGTNVSWVTLAAADISGVSPDSTSNAHHSKTTTASELVDVSADSNADAHHAVFEPADYTPADDVSKSDVGLGNVPNVNPRSEMRNLGLSNQEMDNSWVGGQSGGQVGYDASVGLFLDYGSSGGGVSKDVYPVLDAGNTKTGDNVNVTYGGIDTRPKISLSQGSGSGLDADTVDGYHGNDLAALSENEEFTNGLNITGGNVGIGTTSPDEALHIERTEDAIQVLTHTESGGIHGAWTEYKQSGAGTGQWLVGYHDNGNKFYISGGSSESTDILDYPRMTIDADGRVGIGTSNPSYALDVSGDMRATGEVEAFLGSDRRLKTDLDPLNSALDKVDKLTGYNFDWRNNDSVMPHKRGNTDIGVIAQEVEQVLPNAVKEFEDGHSKGYKSVSYDKLVPLLIEAIKDLRSQVNNLQ